MLYLIDNYDSFTYNLYQLFGTRTAEEVRVVKNDAITVAMVEAEQPTALIFSPGPGRPEDAGNMPAIMHAFRGRLPMFGVCLGMQAMGLEYGGQVTGAPVLMHGREDQVHQTGAPSVLLANCPEQFRAARYHSLVVTALPVSLTVTATGSDGSVMAIENRHDRVYGVQFHPESVMTDLAVGQTIVDAFLRECSTGVKYRG